MERSLIYKPMIRNFLGDFSLKKKKTVNVTTCIIASKIRNENRKMIGEEYFETARVQITLRLILVLTSNVVLLMAAIRMEMWN